jgi:hypothetical protein
MKRNSRVAVSSIEANVCNSEAVFEFTRFTEAKQVGRIKLNNPLKGQAFLTGFE